MAVTGTFDTLTVDVGDEPELQFDDVEYRQNGFSFSAYLPVGSFTNVELGHVVKGYDDSDAISCGYVAKKNVAYRNDERVVCLTMNPPD